MSPAAWQALTWEVARVGGFVAYGLVLTSVVLGLVLSLRWRSVRYPRFVTTELHRFVTLLGIVFIVVHGLAVFVDPFIKLGPAEVLVPFVSHYRPLWVAMGITAGYLALAVYLSERVRSRIGYRAWRLFHYLTFLIFVFATFHGLATGSDSRTPWAMAIYGGSVILIGALLTARLWPVEGRSPRPAFLLLPIVGVVIVATVWTIRGPLAPGWNSAAGGTPSAVVAQVAQGPAAQPAATVAPSTPIRPISLPFEASLTGTARQTGGQDGVVTLEARFVGSADGRLEATIPLSDDAASAPLTMTVDPSGATCTGSLTFARGQVLGGSCSLPDGRVLGVAMRVGLDDSGTLVGTLQVTNERGPTTGRTS